MKLRYSFLDEFDREAPSYELEESCTTCAVPPDFTILAPHQKAPERKRERAGSGAGEAMLGLLMAVLQLTPAQLNNKASKARSDSAQS